MNVTRSMVFSLPFSNEDNKKQLFKNIKKLKSGICKYRKYEIMEVQPLTQLKIQNVQNAVQ